MKRMRTALPLVTRREHSSRGQRLCPRKTRNALARAASLRRVGLPFAARPLHRGRLAVRVRVVRHRPGVVHRAFEVRLRRHAIDDDRARDEGDQERVEENRHAEKPAPRVARDVSHAREGDHACSTRPFGRPWMYECSPNESTHARSPHACRRCMLVRAAVLGILAGCASHQQETARVTVTPVSAASVAPIAGALTQPAALEASPPPPPGGATICDIDPSACAKTSCGGKAACAGHP